MRLVMLNFSDDTHHKHLVELRAKHISRLRELEIKQATLGYNTPPEITLEIKDIQDRIDDIDKQLSKSNISEVETIFHKDLNSLIQHTENDFEEIKGKEDFVAPETGTVAYKSKFSFEYST
jgi:paraquat-inducible protein B